MSDSESRLFLNPNLEWLTLELEITIDYLEYRLGKLGAEGEILLMDVKRAVGVND